MVSIPVTEADATLETWAQIYAELQSHGVNASERTIRRWAKKRVDPLPVFRFMGQVRSKRSMIRDWYKRSYRHVGMKEIPHSRA